ncbi:MAG: flagellar protein FlgN [Rhodoferax sp.]|nr:flagellar protein FlgN [Rhodoferax sp.]
MSSALQALLGRERAAIQAYIELLDKEAKALGDSDFARLPELANLKSETALRITALEQQRDQEQLALGYAAGRAGAEAACAVGSEELAQTWQDVLLRAEAAHARNHRNGVMIHTQLEFTRQTLGFLQASGQPLYGPDGGHKSSGGGGVSLAQG